MASGPPPPPLTVLRGHVDHVTALSFGDDIIVSGSADGAIIAWDLSIRRPILNFQSHDRSVLAVCPLPSNSSQVISAGRDGKLKLWDINYVDKKAVATVEYNTGAAHFCNISTIGREFSPIGEINNLVISPILEDDVGIWDIRAKEKVGIINTKLFGKFGMTSTLLLCDRILLESKEDGIVVPSPACILVGHEDGSLSIFDLKTLKHLSNTKIHSQQLMGVDISPTKRNLLVTGGADTLVQRSTIVSDHAMEKFQLHESEKISIPDEGSSCVKYRSDGRIVASAHWDSTVRLFDTKKMKPIAILRHHTGSVYAVDFGPKNTAYQSHFVTAGKDNNICLWNTFDSTYK